MQSLEDRIEHKLKEIDSMFVLKPENSNPTVNMN
jgi:hypothetical protein